MDIEQGTEEQEGELTAEDRAGLQKLARIWRRQAKAGDANAAYLLAVLLRKGLTGRLNDKEGLRWLNVAAEAGQTEAQFWLAYYYERAENWSEALRWYAAAAEAGDAEAQANVGWYYELGRGTDKDNNKACEWYRRAAEQGDDFAQHKLGYLLEMVPGAAPGEAERWYRSAAALGNADAAYNLSLLLAAQGQGKQATRYLKQAAMAGVYEAQCNLAVQYREGDGVRKSAAKARHWAWKASCQRDWMASRNLARGYAEGEFGKPDLCKSSVFYLDAIEEGAPDTVEELLDEWRG